MTPTICSRVLILCKVRVRLRAHATLLQAPRSCFRCGTFNDKGLLLFRTQQIHNVRRLGRGQIATGAVLQGENFTTSRHMLMLLLSLPPITMQTFFLSACKAGAPWSETVAQTLCADVAVFSV